MIILYIAIVCVLLSIVDIVIHQKKRQDEDDPPFGLFTLLTLCFCVPIFIVIILNHLPYFQYKTRTQMEQDRIRIEYELTQYNDVLLQGIHEANEYNKDLLKGQYILHSPIFGVLESPVLDEFEPIQIPEKNSVTVPN